MLHQPNPTLAGNGIFITYIYIFIYVYTVRNDDLVKMVTYASNMHVKLTSI